MFSLIITVISVALVAALSIATVYFGGDAFNTGTESAQASTLLNQAQQIDGAITIFRANNGALPTTITDGDASTSSDDLVPEYLGSEPIPPANATTQSWSVTGNGEVELALDGASADAVCDSINGGVGLGTSDSTYPADKAAVVGNPYGCHGTSGSLTFIFNPEA